MLKGLALVITVVISNYALAQDTTSKIPASSKNYCPALLQGDSFTYMRNAVVKEKDLIFSSDFVLNMCPGFSKIKNEEEKVRTVAAMMSVYSYYETACQSRAKLAVRQPGLEMGGKYWLPIKADQRQKVLNGTPCDFVEMTPANEAQCAIYLATLPEDVEGGFGMLSKANAVKKANSAWKKKMSDGMYALAPKCNPNEAVSKPSQGVPSIGSPAKPAAPGAGER